MNRGYLVGIHRGASPNKGKRKGVCPNCHKRGLSVPKTFGDPVVGKGTMRSCRYCQHTVVERF